MLTRSAQFIRAAILDEVIGDHIGPVPPVIGTGKTVNEVIRHLENNAALLVVDSGSAVGILTRSDLLDYLAASRPTP